MTFRSAFLSFLFSQALLFGGQSLQFSTTNASAPMTARPHSLPSRVELYLHDWNANPTTNSVIISSPAIGFAASLLNGGSGQVLLLMLNNLESVAVTNSGLCQVRIDNLTAKGVY